MSQFQFDRVHLDSHSLLNMSGEQRLAERFITVDDSFQFRCKACGKCCKDREDIAITAYDIYRLAGFFERTPSEFISQYCALGESPGNSLPGFQLLMRAGTCPFLRNKRCFVHAVKPGVCRCYPLGRVFWHDDAGAYFNVNSTTCKHEPQEIKVRDWIVDFATEEAEQIGQLWGNTISCIIHSMSTEKSFREANPERRSNILNVTLTLLYMAYEIKEPFYPQLEKNIDTLRELMAEIYGFTICSVEEFRRGAVEAGAPLSPPNSTRRNADV